MNAANCPIEKFKVSKHKFTLTRGVPAKKKDRATKTDDTAPKCARREKHTQTINTINKVHIPNR